MFCFQYFRGYNMLFCCLLDWIPFLLLALKGSQRRFGKFTSTIVGLIDLVVVNVKREIVYTVIFRFIPRLHTEGQNKRNSCARQSSSRDVHVSSQTQNLILLKRAGQFLCGLRIPGLYLWWLRTRGNYWSTFNIPYFKIEGCGVLTCGVKWKSSYLHKRSAQLFVLFRKFYEKWL